MPSALEKIVRFVSEHHVLTLATAGEEGPYAAPLFYAYDAASRRFVFASDPGTEHARQMTASSTVAAGIYLETDTVGKIQGLQIRGNVIAASKDDAKHYFETFPYARMMRPVLWRLEPFWMKLTDNRLGFGKKVIWQS